jgi:DNA invertase Pin-like site-specific DNA recombinase
VRNYVIALYIRLSVEDFKTESLSIPNQKLILREKAMSLPEWDNSEILEFIDNGHTGTNFERPAVQELLTMVQAGKINCIIVKDLSRFGRNSIETGYFIERVFPLYHTRFISVSDDFDTANFKGDTGDTLNIVWKIRFKAQFLTQLTYMIMNRFSRIEITILFPNQIGNQFVSKNTFGIGNE